MPLQMLELLQCYIVALPHPKYSATPGEFLRQEGPKPCSKYRKIKYTPDMGVHVHNPSNQES